MPRSSLSVLITAGLLAACSTSAPPSGSVNDPVGSSPATGQSSTTGTTSAAPATGASGKAAPAGTSALSPRAGAGSAGNPSSAGTPAWASAGTSSSAGTSGAAAGSGTDSAGAGGAGSADDAGVATGPAAVPAPDAGPRTPKFEKTSCIDPTKAKADTEIDFPCMGIDLWVVVPKACFERACGVIFNIHGGGMTDHTTMEDATELITIGSQNDYIVVHPHKGSSGTWDVGNDKNVVFAGLQEVIQAFDVDRSRVHSTGYSQGGRISWALGCEHADVVASIAPAEENNTHSDCWKTDKKPVRELSVLFQFGKQDAIGGGYASSQTTADQFVKASAMMGPEDIAGAMGTKFQRQRWTSASGNVLEFITHDYTNALLAGHCLVNPKGSTFVNCSAPVDYHWGEEVVKFFQAHPLR